MAIKKGYKQTDIGIIPEDWEVKSMLTVGDSITGLTYSPIDVKPYGTLVLRSSNIQKGRLCFKDNIFVKMNLPLRVTTKENDILICVRNGSRELIGKCAIIDKTTAGSAFGAFMSIYRSDFYKFVFYLFQSSIIQNQIQETLGATINQITNKNFSNFQIPFPPTLVEQTAIATTLSDIDTLIAALDKKIAKKKLIKQGAMQQLLTGKKRLQGFSGEWIKKKLGNVVQFERGQMITSSQFVNGSIPVIAGGKTYAGFHNVSNRQANAITISASGANAGYVFFHTDPIFASDCSTISENETFNLKYIFYLLQYKQEEIYKTQTGGAQPHIHPKDIEPLEIFFPLVKSEQTAIAQILSDMDNEIAALETKRDKYKLLKDGMMQELLTGKIRLSVSNQTQPEEKPQKQANVHFRRSIWAAEIADRLCDEPTFGHVKMEKLIFLTENMCGIDIGSNYHRDVAGPYDNRAIRSIDSQLKKQNWFDVQHRDKGYRYVPLTKRGGHKSYFNNYYSDVLPIFNNIIDTCRIWDTERCEVVATLYSAWKDLENTKQQYTDNDIINDAINNWNESKKRIPKERWQKALGWMRKNGFSPIDI